MCRLVLQILTPFQTKKCDFSHPFSDLASKKLFHHFLDWNANKIDFLACVASVSSRGSSRKLGQEQKKNEWRGRGRETLATQAIDFLKSISNSHISLSLLLIWNWNDKYFYSLSWFPRKPYPIPGQNGQSLYPFSDQNGAKTIPFGAAHTYVAYVRKYPTGHWIPPSSGWDVVSSTEITTTILTPTSTTTTTTTTTSTMSFICMTYHTSTYSIAIANLFYS